jgi:CBS domain-containing protein
VVTGTDGHVDGIERDILQALSAEGAGALVRPVAEIMTCKVMTCAPSDRLVDVMATMMDGKLRHLPVLENGRLVGIVSIRDVVESRLKQIARLDEILRQIAATEI